MYILQNLKVLINFILKGPNLKIVHWNFQKVQGRQ